MFQAIFDLDNPVFRFLSRLVDLVVLNVLFLISCIPVFTIGAALTALYYVCINDWNPQDAHIFKKYTKSFKENFKKSTIIWLIMLAAGVVVGTDLWYMLSRWRDTGVGAYRIGIIICIICTILYLCIFTYVWPLQAKFENKIAATLKNALGMAVAHLPETLIAWCIAGVAGYCVYRYTIMLAMFLVLLCSTVAYIQSTLFRNVFAPYLGLEEDEEDDGVWSRETETEVENRYADAKIEAAKLAEAMAEQEAEEAETTEMSVETQETEEAGTPEPIKEAIEAETPEPISEAPESREPEEEQ